MGWCVCMYVSVWDFVCAREALKNGEEYSVMHL